MITVAVSELVLNANANSLKLFDVDVPLTEEACGVICKQCNLRTLQIIIDRPTMLPTLVLPNLTNLQIEYHHGLDWLQGFNGASLGKLTELSFPSVSDSIGNFLGASETVALTTSIPSTLSTFKFFTSHPWRPIYHSLFRPSQLQVLTIKSSCEPDCLSELDDDTVTDLARAMPRLVVLQLGDPPCETPVE